MSFCRNCGSEIPEGTKFCSNCGAPVEGKAAVTSEPTPAQEFSFEETPTWGTTPATDESVEIPTPEIKEEKKPAGKSGSGFDRFGKYIGIGLLVLAVVGMECDSPFVMIVLAALIIGGSIFCLEKKYKLRFFTILAMIIAVLMLITGIDDAAHDLKLKKLEKQWAQEETTGDTIAEEPEENTSVAVEESKTAEIEEVEEITEEPTAEEAQEESATEKKDGIDPELKAYLDSYEEFIDEYVAFMKKYNESDDTLSLMADYASMMQKAAKFDEMNAKYDANDMTDEEFAYYMEVMTRCNQKMMEVY